MRAKALILGFAAALALSGAAMAQADPFAALPKSVTLVLSDGLMLMEEAYGVSNSRTIKLGDEYRDGWKLEAVGASEATFRKGGQTRKVGFGARGEGTAQTTSSRAAATDANLTNAVEGARAPTRPAQADRARIATAVAARDVRGVYQAGGSAQDVVAAMRPGSPAPDQANFVNMNGRLGVQMINESNGRNMNLLMVPREFEGFTPPVDAAPYTPPALPPGGDGNLRLFTTPLPAPAAQ